MARAASSSGARSSSPATLHRLFTAGGFRSIASFGASVIALSALFSLAALPFVDLSWWKVFRRCVSVAAAVSLWLAIVRFEGRRFRDYGLDLASRAGRRDLLAGLSAGVVGLGLLLGLGLLTGACRIDITSDQAKLWRTVLVFIPGALLVGLLEELVFRGYLLRQLQRYGTPAAWLLTGALYAAVHLKTQHVTPALWRELTGLLIFGIVLAGVTQATGRLSAAIGLHAALAYGARVNKLLVAIPESPWSWVTGSTRLINGVASWVLLLVVGGLLMWWGTRNTQREA